MRFICKTDIKKPVQYDKFALLDKKGKYLKATPSGVYLGKKRISPETRLLGGLIEEDGIWLLCRKSLFRKSLKFIGKVKQSYDFSAGIVSMEKRLLIDLSERTKIFLPEGQETVCLLKVLSLKNGIEEIERKYVLEKDLPSSLPKEPLEVPQVEKVSDLTVKEDGFFFNGLKASGRPLILLKNKKGSSLVSIKGPDLEFICGTKMHLRKSHLKSYLNSAKALVAETPRGLVALYPTGIESFKGFGQFISASLDDTALFKKGQQLILARPHKAVYTGPLTEEWKGPLGDTPSFLLKNGYLLTGNKIVKTDGSLRPVPADLKKLLENFVVTEVFYQKSTWFLFQSFSRERLLVSLDLLKVVDATGLDKDALRQRIKTEELAAAAGKRRRL